MSRWTTDQIKQLAEEALSVFDDGFQFSDFFKIVPLVMKVVRDVENTTGPEKKDLAVLLGNYIIDETNTPWLPDPVTDPILKDLLPAAIQMAWDFYAGKHDLGSTDATDGAES